MEHWEVERLALRAPDHPALRRGARLVEEALATLGGQESELVVIRHVDLGVFRSDASTQTVALAIDRALREATRSLVPAGDPHAPEAGAVSFRSPEAAAAALVVQCAQGREPREWYWPRAVPGFRPGTASEAIATLLRRVRESGALPTLLAIAHAVCEAGVADAVVARLPESECLAALLWLLPPASGAPRLAPRPAAGNGRDDAAQQADAPAPEPRAALVAALEALAERPGLAGTPALAAEVESRIAVRASSSAAPRGAASRGAKEMPASMASRPSRQEGFAAADASPAASGAAEPADEREPLRDRPRGPALGPKQVADEPTGLGGLLFLLRPLEQLGLADFLAREPDWIALDLPQRVLLRVAASVGGAPEDAMFRILAADDDPETTGVPPFAAPSSWQRGIAARQVDGAGRGGEGAGYDATGQLLLRQPAVAPGGALAGSAKSAADEVARAWQTALRRWCRRAARLGLFDVVRREARVSATPTRIDVRLPLDGAEPRIRRAGLDLDPGFVPWFGRIVRFHYGASGLEEIR